MASTDANPIPIKNTAYRVSFPILDADGDLVTGATGLDSEVSKDGGTFADCTSEATEIATSSGMYFLDLTATEMNADTVCIIVKTTSSGAKTTPMILYPNKSGGLAVNVTAWAGSATATTNVALKTTLAKTTDITGFNDLSTANVQTELTTYGALKPTVAARTLDVSSTGEAGVDWANVGAPTTVQNLSGTTIKAVTDPGTLTSAYDAAKTAATQASVNTVDARLDTEIPAILAAVDTEVAAIKAKTDNLPVDPADASDIASSFTTVNSKLDASAAYVDTEVAAIKAVTDKLDTALVVDGAVYQYTANALELAPVGGGGGGDASQATLLAVKAKTDALPTDPADASDIAASFSVTNGKVDAVAAKTNNLPSDPADASDIAASFAGVNTKLDAISSGLPLDASELNAIADALLKRDWTAVTGEASRSVLNALRLLRNKWTTVETANTLTVKKEDDATTAWTAPLTTDATAAPITSMDPT